MVGMAQGSFEEELGQYKAVCICACMHACMHVCVCMLTFVRAIRRGEDHRQGTWRPLIW